MNGVFNTDATPGEQPAAPVISVRLAGPSDAEGVAKCLAAAFEPYRDAYTPEAFQDTVLSASGFVSRLDEMAILVAEDETSTILGAIAFAALSDGEGHLRGMAVAPDCQGSGVATKLLVAAETALAELACSRVTLDTTAPLTRAIRFYTRNGYRTTGALKDFFAMPLFEYVKNWADEPA